MSDMVESKPAPSATTLEEILAVREQTERLAAFARRQLEGYIETLRPLLSPSRIFGRHAVATAREDVPGSDKAFALLQQAYREKCGKPFGIGPELPAGAVNLIDTTLVLHPSEYAHEIDTSLGRRTFTITSPTRWVLSYRSEYSFSQIRQLVGGNGDRQPDAIREFLVNALAIEMVVARNAGLAELLNDLRYHVSVERYPGLGALPLVTIAAAIPSYRPLDRLIVEATRLSGVQAFIELVDVSAIERLEDPLRSRFRNALAEPPSLTTK